MYCRIICDDKSWCRLASAKTDGKNLEFTAEGIKDYLNPLNSYSKIIVNCGMQ